MENLTIAVSMLTCKYPKLQNVQPSALEPVPPLDLVCPHLHLMFGEIVAIMVILNYKNMKIS